MRLLKSTPNLRQLDLHFHYSNIDAIETLDKSNSVFGPVVAREVRVLELEELSLSGIMFWEVMPLGLFVQGHRRRLQRLALTQVGFDPRWVQLSLPGLENESMYAALTYARLWWLEEAGQVWCQRPEVINRLSDEKLKRRVEGKRFAG